MEGRLCPICRVYKPLSEYGKRMRKGRNVGQAYCIPCKRIFERGKQRERRKKKMNIDVLLDKGAKMPVKAHPDTDAGFDLFTPYEFTVKANGSAIVNTGTHMIIPRGFCGVLISKSGLNTRFGIQTTGLVDADYTGEIVVKVLNHGEKDYHFNKGDKVSQIMILPVPEVTLNIVNELPETERGTNGFGSSGR